MRCQQVLCGAANRGDGTVLHGSYKDYGYTVYCTGCDVVVLDDKFERVQLLDNISRTRSLITAIALSPVSGLIAAVSFHCIYILKPTLSQVEPDWFPLQWSLYKKLEVGSTVNCAAFSYSGNEILIAGTQILLHDLHDWRCIWNTHVTEEVTALTVSPDDRFFTTLNKDSKLLRVWKRKKDLVEFVSELIPHPTNVIGVVWRSVPATMPSDSVRQVFITSCKDSIGRVWLESPSIHPSIGLIKPLTKTFILGTVLDPFKEANEKEIDSSPYIFQWFNNKYFSFTACHDNAVQTGEAMLSEEISISSYDIADNTEETPQENRNVKMMKEYQHTLAQLIKVWYKSFDLIICISPATGALMGWRVEKIDTSFPFQTLTTRFILKLPWSLTYADARILKPTYTVFSSKIKLNKDRNMDTSSVSELSGTLVDTNKMVLPKLNLVTAHCDGTVNLFCLEMSVDDITMSDISNLVHEVRCSGHRCPPINTVAHPYIPLVITTSCETGDLNQYGYGEVILWRIYCIGPMTTRRTGILELARIDTKQASNFTLISWFPKSFSMSSSEKQEYMGEVNSFVLHFVAYTGSSLEIYRVVTLSETLHSKRHPTQNLDSKFIEEDKLISQSSGSGGTKIYHIGSIQNVDLKDAVFLHTFSGDSVRPYSYQKSIKTVLEEYYVVAIDKAGKVNTIKVTIGKSEDGVPPVEGVTVQIINDCYFQLWWEDINDCYLETGEKSLPGNAPHVEHCSAAADTVATPKFVPPGTQSPYLFSALFSDKTVRFYNLDVESFLWTQWPSNSSSKELKLLRDESGSEDSQYYLSNGMAGRIAIGSFKSKELVVSLYECESSGGLRWVLEDDVTLSPATMSDAVLMGWMSAANGTHILAVVQQYSMWILAPCSCSSLHSHVSGTLKHQVTNKVASWVAILKVDLKTNGIPRPRSLCWNSTGSLLLGVNNELQLFSPWYTRHEVELLESHSHLEQGVGNVFNDALELQPRLPQYHPYVLRQLIDSRKMDSVKLVLYHLLKYLISYSKSTKHKLSEVSTVIDIIPPLPLSDMFNLNGEIVMAYLEKDIETQNADYSALFTSNCFDDSDDEKGILSDDDEHTFIRSRSIAHSESEFDETLRFDTRQAEKLDQYLSRYQLPGLTRGEQLALSCLAITIATTTQSFSDSMHYQPIGQDLDDTGLRFSIEMRYQKSISKRLQFHSLKPNDYIWAFHSSCQTQLIELIPGYNEKKLTWDSLRSVGVGWWVKSDLELKNLIEIVCKTKFQETKDPLECALFYLAMKKKTLLQSLYRTIRDVKMSNFLKNNFADARWKTAAKKNAFVLLSQQRYIHSAAFFLLANCLEDSLEIILKYCNDIQLALVIARLYEEPQDSYSLDGNFRTCFKRILSCHILGKPLHAGESSAGALRTLRKEDNPFLCSMSHWWLGEYQDSLYCLLQPLAKPESKSPIILPNIFTFYQYLHCHPIIKRCKDPVKLPFELPGTTSSDLNSAILLERQMIYCTAYSQFSIGCPFLSLEILKCLEKGFTRQVALAENPKAVKEHTVSVEVKLDHPSDTSWMNFDAPISSRFNLDEEYEISFSSDEDGSVASDESIKDHCESEHVLEPEEELKITENLLMDPFTVQIQLKCCIKILADELRFLPHALLEHFDPVLGPFGGRAKMRTKIDSDAAIGKLNCGSNVLGFKVCEWLKKEVVTISQLCNLKFSDVCDLDDEEDRETLDEILYFTFRLEESVLTVLLLFCILHGDLNYNLAALKLELLFLLQEFHSAGDLSGLISVIENESSASEELPPLLISAAPPPLILTPLNILWQLSGHILKLIGKCPITHGHTLSEVHILHSLSLSASACLWQCLALRHGGSRIPDSYAVVKHQPLNWPGLSGHSVHFLVSAGKAFLVNKEREGAQPIAVVLIEAIVAVYLGLFLNTLLHCNPGEMATLMRNIPVLDMWAKVTGSTVQSVEKSPGTRKKHVSYRSDNIRVKGPRFSEKKVVTVRETFLPPSMSLVEYYKRENVREETIFEVDSDCEETLDDMGEDHDNLRCYSWYLMRLLSVIYVRNQITIFMENIGILLNEIASMSPLLASTLKTLDIWVSIMEQDIKAKYPEGLPDNVLPPVFPGNTIQQSLHDPEFSPFRCNTAATLPTRVLWHFLATHTDMAKYLVKEDPGAEGTQEDSESGVRTVFRAQEGVSSFATYQNNLSLMVVSTPKELLELDIKTCLERDIGVKIEEGEEESPFLIISADDKAGGKTPHVLNSQISNADSTTSIDSFNQVLKRPEHGVRCIQAHSDLPLYITGHTDGYVKLWEFGYFHHLAKYSLPGNRGRITSLHFGPLGAKFGLSDANGVIGLWHTTVNAKSPFCVLSCHDRSARDFAFLGSASVLASVGSSSNNRNVVLWDTLLPPSECAIKKFQAHELGAMVCEYSPSRQVLITGGNKGDICIFDIRQRKLQHFFNGHGSAVRSICITPNEELYITGSADGEIKSWSFTSTHDPHVFTDGHKSTKFFSNLPGGSVKGVMKLQVDATNHLVSCGADGEVKIRRLVL